MDILFFQKKYFLNEIHIWPTLFVFFKLKKTELVVQSTPLYHTPKQLTIPLDKLPWLKGLIVPRLQSPVSENLIID